MDANDTLVPASYYARVKDTKGNIVTLLTFWLAFDVKRILNDVGSFTLSLPANDVHVQYFGLDYQVELLRNIPGILAEYVEFEGLVRYYNYAVSEKGERTFEVRGTCYNGLLQRRQIAFNQGTIRAEKEGPSETVMKQYVSENCGPAATVANGRASNGVFPGFITSVDEGKGLKWSGVKSFVLLLDVLKDIAASCKTDFQVIGTGPAEFTFFAYPDGMGKDKTYIDVDPKNELNYKKNKPVVFSEFRGNLTSINHIVDATGEATVCFVLGKGSGSTRRFLTRYSSALADSPWNIIEVSRSGSAQSYEYQLAQLGDDILMQKRRKDIVNLTPQQSSSCVYGKDFSLGDYISVLKPDTGEMSHKHITSTRLYFADMRDNLEIKFEDK